MCVSKRLITTEEIEIALREREREREREVSE